jgi:hypothetical protein
VTCSILDNLIQQAIGVTSLLVSQAASPPRATDNKQIIGVAEEALQLGELSGATLGYAVFVNLDSVNFVEIRVATGSTKFIKLKPGEVACFRFGSGVTAPFAIADTAPCLLRFKIWEG